MSDEQQSTNQPPQQEVRDEVPSSTSPAPEVEKTDKSDKTDKKGKRNNKPRIEFSTLPDTIEELEGMVQSIKKNQGKRPEFKEREQLFAQIDKKINTEQEQITKLKEKVYEKNVGNVGLLEDQLKSVRSEIDELNKKIDEIRSVDQAKRDKTKQAFENVKTLIEAKRAFVQENFVKGFDDEDKIYDEIERLNYEIATQPHNVKKENQLIQSIVKLERSLNHLPRLYEFEHSINLAINQRNNLKEAKTEDKDFEALWAKLKEKREKSQNLRQKIQEKKQQNQEEYKTLKEKRENVKKLIREKREVASKFSSLAEEFHDNERKIRACEAKIEYLKKKQEIEERKRAAAERKAKREAYLAMKAEQERLAKEAEEQRIKQEKETQAEKERKEEEDKLRNPHREEIEELKPLLAYLNIVKSGAGKRQRNKSIQHPVDKTLLFAKYEVSIPKAVTEVPGTIDVLQKKLQTFEKEIIDGGYSIEELRKMRGVEAPTNPVSIEEPSTTPETA